MTIFNIPLEIPNHFKKSLMNPILENILLDELSLSFINTNLYLSEMNGNININDLLVAIVIDDTVYYDNDYIQDIIDMNEEEEW